MLSPSPVPTLIATLVPGAAPQTAAEFDLNGQVVEIGFPLLPESRYHYRDNFLEVRDGPPDDYNHARINHEGILVRLHDGTDIYAQEGEPLVAPFSGLVIDPVTRWQPWEPSRYGGTVVIVSDEPTSMGYVSLFAHMDRVWVAPGTRVSRGQVVGTVGRTGNLEGQELPTHVHFELRAPFLLDWSLLGEDRLIDAFDAYPSLERADPNRN